MRTDHSNRLWLSINAELWYGMMITGGSREHLLAELAVQFSVAAA